MRMWRSWLLAAGLALGAGLAVAQSPADAVVQQLRAQGYGEFAVSRTLLGRVRVVAVAPDGSRREIVFNPSTGEILRDYSEAAEGGAVPRILDQSEGQAGPRVASSPSGAAGAGSAPQPADDDGNNGHGNNAGGFDSGNPGRGHGNDGTNPGRGHGNDGTPGGGNPSPGKGNNGNPSRGGGNGNDRD